MVHYAPERSLVPEDVEALGVDFARLSLLLNTNWMLFVDVLSHRSLGGELLSALALEVTRNAFSHMGSIGLLLLVNFGTVGTYVGLAHCLFLYFFVTHFHFHQWLIVSNIIV